MRMQKCLEPLRVHVPGDLSYLEAASSAKFPIRWFFTRHSVVHLGENLYITFINNYLGEKPVHLILYQYSDVDLNRMCKYIVLYELDTLFKDGTSNHNVLHLGGRVVCMASILDAEDLRVVAFKVNGIVKKANLLGNSIRLPRAIPDSSETMKPRFIFTIDDHPSV